MTKFILKQLLFPRDLLGIKKLAIIMIMFCIAFSLNSCTRRNFERIPPLALQKFRIYPPKTSIYSATQDFNCYKNASNTGAKIKFFINVTASVFWTDGDRNSYLHEIDNKSISVTPTVGFDGFPVDIYLNIAEDETVTVVEFYMQGDECSTCANGYSDESETPFGKCDFFQIPNSSPTSYRAAYPRWTTKGQYSYGRTNTTISIGLLGGLSTIEPSLIRMSNLSNSCGCTVN